MAKPIHIRQVVTILRDRLASILGFTHEGNRDLYITFGWPKQLLVEQLFAMYYRNGLANRIIKAFPAGTWRDPPLIRDDAGSSADEETDDFSTFVKSYEDCFKKHNIMTYLERADRVSGTGRFGLLLLGFRDGLELDQPMSEGNFPLLYVSVYSDPNVTINQWETNAQDPRYGKPLYYTLQTGNPVVGGGQSPSGQRSFRCHWSRVIHIAEYLDEDEVYGLPRLVPVFNLLQDLEKLLGAGAETYWFNARGGMVWSADKDANFSDAEIARMELQADEFGNQLKRITALQGVTPTMLQSSISDPGPLLEKQLDVIAGATGIPKRILIGSERGELSSDQDENNWAQRLEERRINYATPFILKPVISKLILTGNIIQPEGQWEVQWPGDGLGPQKAAEIGQIRSNTLRNYVTSPGADIVVPEPEFRKEFLGLDPKSEYTEEEEEELDEDALLEEPEVPELPNGAGDRAAVGILTEALKTGGRKLHLTTKQLHLFKGSAFGKGYLKTHTLPRSLYVKRMVLNADDIISWAQSQGFSSVLGPDEMHVTVMYSQNDIDWFKVPDAWNQDDDGELIVKPGGARAVEQFDGGAVVLRFKSENIEYRHQEVCRSGASHKYPGEYAPHITLTYDLDGLELSEVEPYTGKIELGPEIFEECNSDYRSEMKELVI